MTSTIARLGFISISLLTIGLSLWKSSELNHAVYLTMETMLEAQARCILRLAC